MMFNILYRGQKDVYNVGGKSTLTIANLAHCIGDILDVPVTLGDKGLSGAPSDVKMCIDRYTKEFGEMMFISIREGLKKTINYQKDLYLSHI